jgi:UDP-glucuronate 4-epimerase
MEFIGEIERAVGRKAKLQLLPMQIGEVKETFADIEASRRDLRFEPKTPIGEGVPRFVAWYQDFYGTGRA